MGIDSHFIHIASYRKRNCMADSFWFEILIKSYTSGGFFKEKLVGKKTQC